MNYLAASIEQLDLAAAQLHSHSVANDRFALILTDNIVELMLHHRSSEEFRWDKRKWNPHPKYKPADRKTVLGHWFEEKVKFCKELKVLSSDDAVFVEAAHAYRNELYHAGIRHDPIIHALAWHYHTFACTLFDTIYAAGSSGWSSNVRVSSSVEKYVQGGTHAYLTITKQIPRIAGALSQAKPACNEPLGQVLCAYLLQRCEELEGSLTFLVADNPNGLSESEMLTHVQFHEFMLGDDSKHLDAIAKCTTCTDLHLLMQTVKRDWKPPISRNPIQRWKKRATQLAGEQRLPALVKKFKGLDDEMWDFEHLVHDAATTMAVDLDI